MDVYVNTGRTRNRLRFHSDPDCPYVRTHVAVPVTEIDDEIPCMRCFPDAPRPPAMFKPYCHRCRSFRACRHNGGVEVVVEVTLRHDTGVSHAGETHFRRIWVWPEHAARHQMRV